MAGPFSSLTYAYKNQRKTEKVVIVAALKINPGKEARFEELISSAQEWAKSKEPGTLTYRTTRVVDKNGKPTGTYIVFEEYANKAALAAHSTGPPLKVILGEKGFVAETKLQFAQGYSAINRDLRYLKPDSRRRVLSTALLASGGVIDHKNHPSYSKAPASSRPRSSSQLDLLPDELLEQIAEHCVGSQIFLRIRMTEEQENINIPDGQYLEPETRVVPGALDGLSRVDRRLRRISLPILFRHVHFFFCRRPDRRMQAPIDPEEILDFQEAFKNNVHLASMIRFDFARIFSMILLITGLLDTRHVKITTRSTTYVGIKCELLVPFLIDIVQACPGLERLELPFVFHLNPWKAFTLPLFDAIHEHPNPKLRAVLNSPSQLGFTGASTASPPVSLSRVLCLDVIAHMRVLPLQVLSLLLEAGLHFEGVSLCLSDMHTLTFPGLCKVNNWRIILSHQEFEDFMARHPLLDMVHVWYSKSISTFVQENLPWTAKSLAAIPSKYCCELDGSVAVRQHGRGSGSEWHIEFASLAFSVTVPEELPDAMNALANAFPRVLDLKLDIRFDSEDDQYPVLDMSDITELLAKSFPLAWSFYLGDFVINSLIRSLGSEHAVPAACRVFCETLASFPSMRNLKRIAFNVPRDLVPNDRRWQPQAIIFDVEDHHVAIQTDEPMGKKKTAAASKATAKAAKRAKAAQKVEKKEKKKGSKSKDVEDDDQDLESILEKMRVEWEEAHKVTEELVEGPPSRRANATLTACPNGNHLWCIGGEFF
ncbi:hypothetical protein D9758_016822 [Tetrapyrgos nigripes]|uniref:ABM domain-containing protein n=1 Tax=Tetrapyrgos nigripes TaxID=182062 RepID=A0A8H5BSV0_9AGAR|nr:hypothetical protein D9758_016822 [Tetrapyrgos nigripes]